ncbi:MAG TPA: glycerophosphodiester phosphodiesterase family protein [Daejeonella sp.]|nr:glycerophosphodiester phosphodiesterase family protein [Daejeonella sp.]
MISEILKRSFLSLIGLIYLAMGAFAQENNLSILLTDYTFSAGKSEIALIKLNHPEVTIKKIILKGEDAKAFQLAKNNQLILLKKYNNSEVKWYNLVIEAETSAGKLTGDFRIVNDQFIKNKVIAHRGAWKNTGVTENSIASLKHAINLGCMGSEFDVHMSSDSVPFIHHDPNLNSVFIEKTSAAELSQMKLSNGENLPTLVEYLQEGTSQNKTKLILEIKSSIISKERGIALTRIVADLVKKHKAQAWVEYISFDYDICKELLRLDPYAKVAYLNGDKSPEELASDKMYGLDYNFKTLQKKEEWIKEAQHKNLSVNVWTVNDGQVMDWFLERNVDFITTNEPELLLEKVKK